MENDTHTVSTGLTASDIAEFNSSSFGSALDWGTNFYFNASLNGSNWSLNASGSISDDDDHVPLDTPATTDVKTKPPRELTCDHKHVPKNVSVDDELTRLANESEFLSKYGKKIEAISDPSQRELVKRVIYHLAAQLDGSTDEWKRMEEKMNLYDKNVSQEVGKRWLNMPKNRFANVIPFDHSRVELPNDGYINANAIMYDGTIMVLTQKPDDRTIRDYFEMLLTHRVKYVVDLAGSEYFKCATGYDVMVLHNSTTDGVEVQKIRVRDHELMYIKYCDWGDSKTPKSIRAIYHMLELVDPAAITATNCLAGVGRSGTFWAAFTIKRLLSQGLQYINVSELINHAREYRTSLVQTIEQYRWLIRFTIRTVLKMFQ